MRSSILPSLKLLVPLNKSNWNVNCSLCDKPQSRWTLRVESPKVFVCSLCVLYESKWAETNEVAVRMALLEFEKSAGRKLTLNEGRILSPSDADDVLGYVVLMDRLISRMTGKR